MLLLLMMSTAVLVITADIQNMHALHEQEMKRKNTAMLQQSALESLIHSGFSEELTWSYRKDQIHVQRDPLEENRFFITVTSGSYTREAEFVYNEESRQISAWKERVWSHD
ncbi:competence type IV pilus minor pilin ComGG [Bacillus daqingensis]